MGIRERLQPFGEKYREYKEHQSAKRALDGLFNGVISMWNSEGEYAYCEISENMRQEFLARDDLEITVLESESAAIEKYLVHDYAVDIFIDEDETVIVYLSDYLSAE